ncbi:MAG: hypothetical protein ACN4GZ_02355 [Acidimicrobiales bacterium]
MSKSPAALLRRSVHVGISTIAVSALLLSACGDEADGTESSDDPSVLIGVWELESVGVTWLVADDTITATTPGGEVVSQYTATDTTIEIGEETGPNACPPGQPGVYDWSVDADTLSLTVVSDSCGRVNVLDGATFTRTQ